MSHRVFAPHHLAAPGLSAAGEHFFVDESKLIDKLGGNVISPNVSSIFCSENTPPDKIIVQTAIVSCDNCITFPNRV